MTEETLFDLILKTPESERAALLSRACEGKPELRLRIEALLKADAVPAKFLEQPAAFDATTGFEATASFTSGDAAGVVIAGRYKLLEEIGEGGMGTVWMAQQSEPVKRLVAIKLIKAGMDSKAVLARFEAERQALAMMDHPNIAKVLDGGLTGEPGAVSPRRPYFVMELVKGTPITKFCDERKLSLKERLELFVPVCQAIQHAHQKGVIHRDIKPSNVLIALYDDKPVPKVIDFGVAKATGAQLTDQTLNTGFGAVVGTPEYMSPEQASLNNLDIDTRSDVYALGVVLYELLTGTTPVDKKSLGKAALMEVLRIVREVEAPKPSTKLSSSEALPTIAANRHTEPAKLSNLMKGELDWIVMKALEKDRSRRYETANGFAADVLRYLSGEAVTAVPPSATYRLQKFLKKNKRPVLAASLVFLALLGGILGTTLGLFEAKRQEKLANIARDAEVERAKGERQAKMDAEAQKEQAQKRLKQIEKANDILGSIFENLDPKEIAKKERPLQAILVEKLDKAVEQLEGEAIGDPLVVAAMQLKISQSLMGLGEPAKAIVLLEKARATFQSNLGHNHVETISSMHRLATAYTEDGKYERALPLFEETLRLAKSTLGPDHPDTLGTTNNLALAYRTTGKLSKALPLFETVFKFAKANYGPDDPKTLTCMDNLAGTYLYAGTIDKALLLFEENSKLRKAKFGLSDPDTLTSMNNLAIAYQAAGKLDLALPLFEETLKLIKDKLGTEHPLALTCMDGLATSYKLVGRLDQALSMFEATLKLSKFKRGAEHPDTITTMNNLGQAYQQAGKLEQALPLLKEALRLSKVKLGPSHYGTLSIMNNLALAYQQTDQIGLAIPLYTEAIELLKSSLGPYHATTLTTMNNLAFAYQKAGKLDLAHSIYIELIDSVRKTLPKDSPQLAGQLAMLGMSLLQIKAFVEAEPLIRDCLAIREKKEPNDWRTFNTKSMLGGALLGQKKYADAEPLLLNGYEGMKDRLTAPGADTARLNLQQRLTEALDRLIQLYTETNKPDEVKKWQAEKDKLPKPSEKK